MSMRGVLTVAGVEFTKLARQLRVRLVLAACVGSPFAFAGAMRVQSSVPADTLFGRAVTDSGFAIPLVVLGFGALWVFPVLATIVGGDLFSAEDRYGTWTTVLTRSRSRAEVFAGKVAGGAGFFVSRDGRSRREQHRRRGARDRTRSRSSACPARCCLRRRRWSASRSRGYRCCRRRLASRHWPC